MVAIERNITLIGSDLRELRLAQGLSLADVSASTKLQTAYIQGIENMTPETLPSIGYVLGFIRTYAKNLGYDADLAVKRYKSDIEAPKHIGMRERAIFVSKRKMKLPRGVLSAASVLIVAASISVWYASHSYSDADVLRKSALANSGNFEVETTAITDPNILTVKAVSPSWVRVTDGAGNVAMSRILVTGDVWRTELGNGMTVSARDGGALEIFRGDKSYGVMGEQGVPVSNVSLRDFGQIIDAETTALPFATDTVLQGGPALDVGAATKGAAFRPSEETSVNAPSDISDRIPTESSGSTDSGMTSGHSRALQRPN